MDKHNISKVTKVFFLVTSCTFCLMQPQFSYPSLVDEEAAAGSTVIIMQVYVHQNDTCHSSPRM